MPPAPSATMHGRSEATVGTYIVPTTLYGAGPATGPLSVIIAGRLR